MNAINPACFHLKLPQGCLAKTTLRRNQKGEHGVAEFPLYPWRESEVRSQVEKNLAGQPDYNRKTASGANNPRMFVITYLAANPTKCDCVIVEFAGVRATALTGWPSNRLTNLNTL